MTSTTSKGHVVRAYCTPCQFGGGTMRTQSFCRADLYIELRVSSLLSTHRVVVLSYRSCNISRPKISFWLWKPRAGNFFWVLCTPYEPAHSVRSKEGPTTCTVECRTRSQITCRLRLQLRVLIHALPLVLYFIAVLDRVAPLPLSVL